MSVLIYLLAIDENQIHFTKLISIESVLIYTSTSNVWKDLFPHSLTNTVYYVTY